MPIHKEGSKYAIGGGKPIYKSAASALSAFRGYVAHMYRKGAPKTQIAGLYRELHNEIKKRKGNG